MNNVINWFDIPTVDFQRAVKFYSEILGENVKVMDIMGQTVGFFPMNGKNGVGGDLIPPSVTTNKPSSQGTRVYLNCDGKLDEVTSRVESAGGAVLREKFHIGEPGWIVIIQDTEGNVIGLHSFQ